MNSLPKFKRASREMENRRRGQGIIWLAGARLRSMPRLPGSVPKRYRSHVVVVHFHETKKPTPVQTSFAQRIANGRARRTQQNRSIAAMPRSRRWSPD